MKTIVFVIIILSALACKKQTEEEKSNSIVKQERTKDLDTFSRANDDSVSITFIEFDKAKWRAKDDHHYIYRNDMLTEIMNNHILDSLKKDEILDLLGEPDRSDGDFLFYQIAQKRLGFWPLHTKTLVIKFDEYALEWIRIHE